MNQNYSAIFAAALMAMAYMVSIGLLRRKPMKVRLAWFFLFLPLALPALMMELNSWHLLKDRAWIYEFRSWRGSEFSCIFMGLACGTATALWPYLWYFLVIPVFVTWVRYMPIILPLPDGTFKDQGNGGPSLLSNPATAAVANVCIILQHLGGSPSEATVAKACFTDLRGTNLSYLARYVRSLGYTAHFEMSDRVSASDPLPALFSVSKNQWPCFLAVLEIKDDRVTYIDPLQGREQIALPEFQKSYEFSGVRLIITK